MDSPLKFEQDNCVVSDQKFAKERILKPVPNTLVDFSAQTLSSSTAQWARRL